MAQEIEITLKGNEEGEILLSTSEDKQLTIKNNSTNARDIFELLDFKPGSKYKVSAGDEGKVNQKVFEEFVSLIERIRDGINGLSARTPEENAADKQEDPDRGF